MADFISKNRIFDLIHAVYSVHGFTSYEDYVGLLKDVETSTNADVQLVKHGRWECIGHDDKTYWYRCSVCGHEEHDNMTKHDKYCSSCGARMDGEQNEDN